MLKTMFSLNIESLTVVSYFSSLLVFFLNLKPVLYAIVCVFQFSFDEC